MPLLMESPIKVTATKIAKFACFLPGNTHSLFQKKLLTKAIEKDAAFIGIIPTPFDIPVTAIKKFNMPKSIAVFKKPTAANLPNCQNRGIFLPIRLATNNPDTPSTGIIKNNSIGEKGSLPKRPVLISVGIKNRATKIVAAAESCKSFFCT